MLACGIHRSAPIMEWRKSYLPTHSVSSALLTRGSFEFHFKTSISAFDVLSRSPFYSHLHLPIGGRHQSTSHSQ